MNDSLRLQRAGLPRGGVRVQVLIVEHNRDLAGIWSGFLARQGMSCTIATSADDAYAALRDRPFDALVLDMELTGNEALAVADFATYRNPDVPIIAVTSRAFFSDGLIFQLVPNARGLLRSPLKPDDMAALVEHYANRAGAAQASARMAVGQA